MAARDYPLIGLTTRSIQTEIANSPVDFHGLAQAYIGAVRAAGGAPVLLPHGATDEELGALAGRLDGLLLTGGKDVDPAEYGEEALPQCGAVSAARDRLEFSLVRHAVRLELPLLAICRGPQVVNVALGGSLWQDLPAQLPNAIRHNFRGPEYHAVLAHRVTIAAGSRLQAILGAEEVGVNSSHHQAIRELADGLVATAHAPDGVIEGVELPGHSFAVGVQWHPELMYREHPIMLRLFEALVEAARGTGRGI